MKCGDRKIVLEKEIKVELPAHGPYVAQEVLWAPPRARQRGVGQTVVDRDPRPAFGDTYWRTSASLLWASTPSRVISRRHNARLSTCQWSHRSSSMRLSWDDGTSDFSDRYEYPRT